MVKRKEILSIVENEGTIAKKFRNDVDINRTGPSFDSNVEVTSENETEIASIDCLYEDVLIEIFQWLSVRDRICVERVCRKWYWAAKKSWSNFRYLHCMQPYDLISVLRRAGKFIGKLDISDSEHIHPNDFICEALSLTPNVKHLKLALRSEAHVMAKVVKLSAQLKSFSIYLSRKPIAMTLNKLMSQCNQLEHLELVRVKDYKFDCLPSSLKSLAVSRHVNCVQLMEVLIGQKTALEALSLPFNYVNPEPCIFLTKMDLSKLRFLSIHLCPSSWASFSAVSCQLSHLVALELRMTYDYDILADEVVDAVVSNMWRLQYLSIWNFHHQLPTNFAKFADLKHLIHVTLSTSDLEAVCQLLRALIEKEKLQYFYTSTFLPSELLCDALNKCKTLTHLVFLWVDQWSQGAMIRDALDQTFGKGTLPISTNDPRIRHFFCGNQILEPAETHPWAIFHDSFSTFPDKGFCEYRVFCDEHYEW